MATEYIITVPEKPNVTFGLSLKKLDDSVDYCSAQFRLTEDYSILDLIVNDEAVIRGIPLLVDSPLFVKEGMQLIFRRTYSLAPYIVDWENINNWYELKWQEINLEYTEPTDEV